MDPNADTYTLNEGKEEEQKIGEKDGKRMMEDEEMEMVEDGRGEYRWKRKKRRVDG